MKAPEGSYVLFKTDLFLWRQEDEDLDQWQVGGWFYLRLLGHGIKPSLDPVMEDWGWTFAVSMNNVKVWTNLWYFLEGVWLFGIDSPPGFLRRRSTQKLNSVRDVVCDALERIFNSDARFLKHQWYDTNPFDSKIESF